MSTVPALRFAALLLALTGCIFNKAATHAADDKPGAPPEKSALDRTISDTLKEVHNRGVDLYNGSDVAGAYRLFQGALLMARPLLANHPDAQKAIDDGIRQAEQNPRLDRRAWTLHETIEEVRNRLKGGGIAKKPETPPAEPAKPADNKADEKKTEPAKPMAKPAAAAAEVTGMVTLNGKPLANGTLSFVAANGQKTTADIKNGKYEVKNLAPGAYRITVSDKQNAVPAKFADVDRSGLMFTLSPNKNTFDLDLK